MKRKKRRKNKGKGSEINLSQIDLSQKILILLFLNMLEQFIEINKDKSNNILWNKKKKWKSNKLWIDWRSGKKEWRKIR